MARGTLAPGAPLHPRVQPSERGWRAGALELAPDELRGDDVRHFAVRIGAPPAVTVAPDAGTFVSGAVAALAQGDRLRAGSEIHISSAMSVRRGQRALLFAPRDPLQIADANRALGRAGIPWAFGARRSGAAPLHGADAAGAIATVWYALESRDGSGATGGIGSIDTLVRVGGDPWAVAGEGYVLVASPADPAATDLPLRASYLPWLDRVIAEHLTTGGGLVTETAPGARTRVGLAEREALAIRVPLRVPAGVDALEAPDGALVSVRAGDPLRAPWRTGVYFWRRGAERAGALVVNPEPEESDLRPLAPDSLAAILGGATTVSEGRALPRAVFSGSARRALDPSFLLFALLLIGAEFLLARRRTSAPPQAVVPT